MEVVSCIIIDAEAIDESPVVNIVNGHFLYSIIKEVSMPVTDKKYVRILFKLW